MTSPTRFVLPTLAERPTRRLLLVIAVTQAALAVLFILQVPWAIALWPFAGATPLSNIFIASIFLAAAASTGWCLLVRSDRGFAGIALDYLTILVPFAVISFAASLDGAGMGVAAFGVVSALGALFGTWLLRWALQHPWRDPRPTPRPVRAAFAVFVVALVLVSIRLILQVPDTLPWSVTPQLSTLFGFMFLGAAAYFVYGIVEPRWENAGGQLAGFLAYDIVLAVPLLQELTSGDGGYYDVGRDDPLSLNLLLYTVVVLASGLLAAYYLLVRPDTRPWASVPATTEATRATAPLIEDRGRSG